ncbi:hypothetical protein evm_011652, partial [Chilo suppressalis]
MLDAPEHRNGSKDQPRKKLNMGAEISKFGAVARDLVVDLPAPRRAVGGAESYISFCMAQKFVVECARSYTTVGTVTGPEPPTTQFKSASIKNIAMSRNCAIVLAICGLAAVTLPGSSAQALSSQYDTSASADSRNNWDAFGGLYALLAQHDALGGHALARKSVRSPSRRLRFGRRSDPDMPPQTPLDEMDELLSLRESRTPVRLRFGRRSDEHATPHVFPQEVPAPLPDSLEQDALLSLRDARSPVRLRYGRRSDEHAVPHIFPQE